MRLSCETPATCQQLAEAQKELVLPIVGLVILLVLVYTWRKNSTGGMGL